MATTRALPGPLNVPATPVQTAVKAGEESGNIQVGPPSAFETRVALKLSAAQARLPVELEVAIPVRLFKVSSLLALEPGQVIETQWGYGDDLPLTSTGAQLAWSEFEVIDTQLAVRVTRLA